MPSPSLEPACTGTTQSPGRTTCTTEGDGSLLYWQSAHRAFFGRECASAGREFTETMLVVCERFAVVYRGTSLAA